MKLSERFNNYSTHYWGIAKDPYMIGISLTCAACAIPFSPLVAGAAAAAPVVYATASGLSALASHGLKLSGR